MRVYYIIVQLPPKQLLLFLALYVLQKKRLLCFRAGTPAEVNIHPTFLLSWAWAAKKKDKSDLRQSHCGQEKKINWGVQWKEQPGSTKQSLS